MFTDLVLSQDVCTVQVSSSVALIELLGQTSAKATYLLVGVSPRAFPYDAVVFIFSCVVN